MALTPLFFSTTAAGSGLGTDWANRAALFTAGVWSPVLTAFDFSANAAECFIGPGTYTCGATLATGLFTVSAPTAANPVIFCGCDSSGVLLSVPDPSWLSCQPSFNDSTLPVIATTTNIATSSLATAAWYLLKFTASGRNGSMFSGAITITWCSITSTTNNSSAVALGALNRIVNCFVTCTGSAHDAVISGASVMINTRIEGVTGSSGNRRGLTAAGTITTVDLCTIVNCGAEGIIVTSTNAAQTVKAERCVIANNVGRGILANSTASQTAFYETHNCMITGNGTAGIDGNSNAARWFVEQNRLRDNTTDITGLGNYPIDLNNYTTDDSDANEYVSTGANGDFSIKNTATNVWGKGFGVRDQPAASTGGVSGIIGDGASW